MSAIIQRPGDKLVTIPGMLNLLYKALAPVLKAEGVSLGIVASKGAALARLHHRPDSLSAYLYFGGYVAILNGVCADASFNLDLSMPASKEEQAGDRGRVSDEAMLQHIAGIASLIGGVTFRGIQAAPPSVQPTDWLTDDDRVAGHRIPFNIRMALPGTPRLVVGP